MKRVCITPCGAKKIWDKDPEAGATRAQDVYIGAFAKASQRYAEAFFDRWIVLSAKHGVLFPDDRLTENYDVSFTSDPSSVITVARLREQWLARGLGDAEEVVVLGGKKYAVAVEKLFAGWEISPRISLPLQGAKGIGYMLQRLNQAVRQQCELQQLGNR
ncbi:DUF6884 domain-containing protein [Tumebacillus flagellatus]|uniref:DUF6884 domain-containing protein n=1 Tax=Tumebacillus flagellatus TaxID=1157490 RepID=A0A074LYY0_9BACL|nr:DUF6884 domain-containing protein [Tumebacillus flagellatus]KEO85263.1 hypothetical protein EL26_01510 [Tumebacillus flagellatus]